MHTYLIEIYNAVELLCEYPNYFYLAFSVVYILKHVQPDRPFRNFRFTKSVDQSFNSVGFFFFGGILSSASEAEFPVFLSNHVGI